MSDEPRTPPPAYATSLDDLSAILGTTERQWRTYAKRVGFPPKVAGKGYDVAACAAWKAEHIKPQGSGELALGKVAKMTLETELLQLRVDKEKRLNVPRAEVDALHGLMAMKLRSLLYTKLENEMPAKLAGCDALAIRVYGRALADEIVTRLQKDIDAWSAD